MFKLFFTWMCQKYYVFQSYCLTAKENKKGPPSQVFGPMLQLVPPRFSDLATSLHLLVAFAIEASAIRARILKPFIVDSKIHNEVHYIRMTVLLYGKSQVF